MFPETAVLAIRDAAGASAPLTVGVVGSEGFVGWSALLGTADTAFTTGVMMQGGTVLAAPADEIAELAAQVPAFRALLVRFVDSFMLQMGATIVSAVRDGVERRLARWLLMLHDRVDGDELQCTHADLSIALNVRRASVTDCLHVMEGDRLLRCVRGRITIRDRARLSALVGGG